MACGDADANGEVDIFLLTKNRGREGGKLVVLLNDGRGNFRDWDYAVLDATPTALTERSFGRSAWRRSARHTP